MQENSFTAYPNTLLVFELHIYLSILMGIDKCKQWNINKGQDVIIQAVKLWG